MGWLGALKLVPWSEVMQAAPELVRGARRIFNRGQDLASSAEAAAAAGTVAAPAQDANAALQAQLQQLTAQVEQLVQQQQASAGLVESLTEHNARLVQAVQGLRLRLRWLGASTAVLAVGLLVLALRA